MEDVPEISYPCVWQYTLIGPDESAIREAIEQIAGDLKPDIYYSNRSKTGKYISLKVQLRVESEEQRRSVFTKFSQHDATKFVL